jgi:lysophospholipase L1-like esterase
MKQHAGVLVILLLLGVVVLSTTGCAAWRLGRAAELARQSTPLQVEPARPDLRLLMVGDSTAVGTGASSPQASLAGLLAQAYPSLAIENRARDGARFEGVVEQLEAGGRFDLVLIMAGGNDVMRMRDADATRAEIDRSARLAQGLAPQVAFLPAGNVGNAPFFFPPISWLMTSRARTLHADVQSAAARTGAVYVNLFKAAADDPFVQRPGLHASDGLHPSDAGYRLWRDELLAQTGWDKRLQAAR